MSISFVGMLMRDTITIKRETVVRTDGVAQKTWTTGARGSDLPTEVTGRAQDLPSSEASLYGVDADVRAYKLYFDESPQITSADHVFFEDADGTERECRVLKPSYSFDGPIAAVWRCDVAEYKATED